MAEAKFDHIYFIGIGGIGMSALARYFHQIGKNVSGYDKTQTRLTGALIQEGIPIHFDDDVNNIDRKILEEKEASLIVFTPAIPRGHKEYNHLLSLGYSIKKRSEVLGLISNDHFSIAVAGTHGKTTTSSIVAHLFKSSKTGCNAFIGGIMTNYNSNLLIEQEDSVYVLEADEFDRSFLALEPSLAILTSTDADHLDIYGKAESLLESFNDFVGKIKDQGKLIIRAEIRDQISKNDHILTYSSVSEADFMAKNITVIEGQFRFDLQTPDGIIEKIHFSLPGIHNIENACAAAAAAHLYGLKAEKIKEGLESYKGVRRRFETIIKNDKIVYIDDYAHHPTELNAAISSAKLLFPNKKITGIFQPHLYSRTRDFADEFSKSLGLLDEIILLPIYPAREEPIDGIDSQLIFNKIRKTSKKLLEKNELLYWLKTNRPEVLLSLGAGDIDQFIEPIKELFQE